MKVTPSKFKPFTYVTREDKKVVIVAGNTQVSPLEFENESQAEQYLIEQPYEMFTNLYSIFRYYETHKEKQMEDESRKNGKGNK